MRTGVEGIPGAGLSWEGGGVGDPISKVTLFCSRSISGQGVPAQPSVRTEISLSCNTFLGISVHLAPDPDTPLSLWSLDLD